MRLENCSALYFFFFFSWFFFSFFFFSFLCKSLFSFSIEHGTGVFRSPPPSLERDALIGYSRQYSLTMLLLSYLRQRDPFVREHYRVDQAPLTRPAHTLCRHWFDSSDPPLSFAIACLIFPVLFTAPLYWTPIVLILPDLSFLHLLSFFRSIS